MNPSINSYRSHFKQTLRLTWPVIIGQLGHIAISFADNAMIGKLGYQYLAAASIANGIFFLILVLGIGLTMAMTPLVAEAFSSNDPENCRKLFNQGLWVNFIFSLFLAALCWFSTYLIPLLGQPPEILPLVASYQKILALTIIPSMVFMTYKQFIEGLSSVRPGMYVMIIVVVSNVGLNYVLIFGKLGFPEMGLNGAGWATLIARIIGMILLGAFVIVMPKYRVYKPWPYVARMGSAVAKKILALGLPSSLQYFFEVGAFTGSAILIGWLGAKPLAAHQLAIHLASITYTISMGFSSAAAIRVANAKGKNDLLGMRKSGYVAIFLGIVFMSLCSVGFILGKNVLPLIYVDDPEVIRLTSILLLIAAFFQISDGIQAIAVGALRGISDVKIPAVMTFVAYWILGLPVGWVLGMKLGWGVAGIWVGISIGLTFSAIFLFLRFSYMTRFRADSHLISSKTEENKSIAEQKVKEIKV